MKSADEYDAGAASGTHVERIGFEDMAKSQWALINSLESEYSGKTVVGTNCKFDDELWFDGDGKSDHGRIIWSSRVTGGKALKVLLKVLLFEISATNRIAVSTLASKFNSLKRSILPLIESKNLLTGKTGEYLLGLNNITDEDLLVMLDALQVSGSTEKGFEQDCYQLTMFLTLVNHIAVSVPVFEIRARLPWHSEGIKLISWIKRRSADLGVIFRTAVGYVPLSSETTMPIIERSLSLIVDHGDQLASISQTLTYFDNLQGRFQGCKKKALQALQKYGPLLGDLIAPPEMSGTTAQVVYALIGWIRALLYLARGACINIILLTTGLRNVDIRGLQVGACSPSKRIDMLFYLSARIRKTKNFALLPVPGQCNMAVSLLERLKFTKSPYLIDGAMFPAGRFAGSTGDTNTINSEDQTRLVGGYLLNEMVRHFAQHFNIPFTNQSTGEDYSLHCYRTTVAGWLGAASNLSVLMVRRLFGHSNDVMPTVYLRNNPAFITEQKAEKARAAAETARQMSLAASKDKLAGNKGDQLERGFKQHVSRYELDKRKSHSMTDAELVISFSDLIEQRILNESVCGFMTPFGVRCMRNPADARQPPCAKRSHSNKTKDLDQVLLNHLSDIDPQNCIGTSCGEAMIGPWSESIKESLLWYAQLLRHQHGAKFTDEHFREHAVQFIRQYGPAIKKVFGVEVLPNGSVAEGKCDGGVNNV